MNYQALKSELANASYATLSDADAAIAVNAKAETVIKTVHSGDVRAALFARGKWVGIVKKANAARLGTDISDEAALCQVIYDLASSGGSIEMTNAATAYAVVTCLSALVAASILAQADVDALLALSSVEENWAARHLDSLTTAHDITIARTM